MNLRTFALTVAFLVSGVVIQAQNAPDNVSLADYKGTPSYDLLYSVFEKAQEIHSLSYQMIRTERFEGKMKTSVTDIKFTKVPFRVYIYQTAPNEGLEVLYKENWNNNKALINPNGFPWVNVSLDPYGGKMRESSHHTLFDTGLDKLLGIIQFQIQKFGPEIFSRVSIEGEKVWEGRNCYILKFANPYFKWIDYTVQPNEDLCDIAKKFCISEYMVKEENNNISNYQDVKAGQVIQIPSDYATEIEMLIDKERLLPLVTTVYDEKGVFGIYSYPRIEVNPSLKDIDFDEDNDEYGF